MPRQYRNWATEIRNIFIEIGQEEIWNRDYINVSYDCFISMAKGTLVDLYIAEWFQDLNNKDKLRFKTVFGYETYLSNINSPNIRRSLTRFRLSSHCLEIEMGRYPPRTPSNRRYCKQCNTLDIYDEFHFLLVCTKFSDLRVKYIPKYYRKRPSMVKFIELFNETSINPILIKNVALYVLKAIVNHV